MFLLSSRFVSIFPCIGILIILSTSASPATPIIMVPPAPASPPQALKPAPPASGPEQPTPREPDQIDISHPDYGKKVTVWYATSPMPIIPFSPNEPYGIKRDNKLLFGKCEVKIPKSHHRDCHGSYDLYLLTGKDEPVTLLGASPINETDYWAQLRSMFDKMHKSERRVLVFIHGYNNSVEDASQRTAQIWADLEIRGIPVLFSWPSRDGAVRNMDDEATTEASEDYLSKFLVEIGNQLKADRIHIIAHGMGNLALLRIVKQAVYNAQQKIGLRFAKVFLAAPDVDLDIFNHLANAYSLVSEKTTLYVSRKNTKKRSTVTLSDGLEHDYSSDEASPTFVLLPKIETVEVRAPKGLLDHGHADFAEFLPVLDDIRSLILTNRPNPQRKWNASETLWLLD